MRSEKYLARCAFLAFIVLLALLFSGLAAIGIFSKKTTPPPGPEEDTFSVESLAEIPQVRFYRPQACLPLRIKCNMYLTHVGTKEETKKVEYVKPVKIWPPLPPYPQDVVYPAGETQSETNDDQHNSGHFRGKSATIWDPHPRYQFSAFGREFLLRLDQTSPFIPSHIKVMHVWHNMTVFEKPSVQESCFYTGIVDGDPASSVSVSLCHGMTGQIQTSNGSFSIEPTEPWTSQDQEPPLHVITRINAPSGSPSCYHDEESEGHPEGVDETGREEKKWKVEWEGRTEYEGGRRRKRSFHQVYEKVEYTIELMVAADVKMAEYHGQDLQHYIFNLISSVDKIFKHASIGNPIGVALVKIVILYDSHYSGMSASEMLNQFCDEQNKLNDREDWSPNHHDAAILLTRERVCREAGQDQCSTLGLAQVGGMCSNFSRNSCAVVRDTGLSAAFTIVHEMGHILHLPHDDDRGCSSFLTSKESHKFIMSRVLSEDTMPWIWSSCSRYYLTEFLEADQGYCLVDPPKKDILMKRENREVQIGESFNEDKQCELVFGKGSKICKGMPVCEKLWCLMNYDDNRSACTTEHQPWADGTDCGNRNWCQKRECVPKDRRSLRPINGGWGKWKKHGDCSRTCGGGIKKQERECDSPRPANGGKYCVGIRVRYTSCNTKECPPNSTDFRQLQCTEFNDTKPEGTNTSIVWVPKYGGISPEDRCKLYCSVYQSSVYYRLNNKVIDGTVCGPDTFDVCVNGFCVQAGCDHVIYSSKQLDRCGICGGDNSTCKEVHGKYNISQYGYTSVARIPAGASNLDIRQHGYLDSNKDDNYLALVDGETHQYILNGMNMINVNKKLILYGGTTLAYTGSDAVVERINSSRPLTKDLIIQVLSIGKLYPPNIEYDYTVQKDTLSQYMWDLSDQWGHCHRICNGESWRIARCVRVMGKQEVAPELCEESAKKELPRKPCNTHCTLQWEVASRSDCSSDCGPGERALSYQCVVVKSDTITITHEASCEHLSRPPRSELCEGPCQEARWHFTNWGQCSKSCGTGVRTRQAFCMDSSNKIRNETMCRGSDKNVEEVCNVQECPVWKVGDWTPCSVTCGGGKRRRAYWCQYGNQRDPNEKCSLPIPVHTESCAEEPCAYWKEEEWSHCSVSCGTGVERRDVSCSVPDACSNITKPQTTRSCHKAQCSIRHENAVTNDIDGSKFIWRHWSPCSVTCGKGEQLPVGECFQKYSGKPVDHQTCLHYHLPTSRSCHMPPCPQWQVGDWEPCPAICGIGMQSKQITCQSYTGKPLPDKACPPELKPKNIEQPCKVPCPRDGHKDAWIKTPWSPCSVSCGTGSRTRQVTCYGQCLGPKPDITMPCYLEPCEGTWNKGLWSQCSASHGEGVQERQVRCEGRGGVVVPDSYCNQPMPPRKQPCKLIYQWETTRWSQCSASCGKGTKRREVYCKSAQGESVSHPMCSNKKKPNSVKICRRMPCPYDWEEGDWSQCSSSCGEGKQFRKVKCIKNHLHGKTVKSTQEVKDIFCNPGSKPEIVKICREYCDGFKWETGQWQPCSKTCNRRGRQKRTLSCFYGKKKVANRYCPKDQMPPKKKKCDIVMCSSCGDLKSGFNQRKDGEYRLWIRERHVPVYCYNMESDLPKEYISLPDQSNYAEIFSKTIRHHVTSPNSCSESMRRGDYCESHESFEHGFTVFNKININVTSLIVNTNDFDFATTMRGSQVPYGEAGDCQTRGLCPEGKFSINLASTLFRVSSETEWAGLSNHAPVFTDISEDGQRVSGRCGGCCGFCKPKNGLRLDLLPP